MVTVLNRCPLCGMEEELEFEEEWSADEGFRREAEEPLWEVLCSDCIHGLHDKPVPQNVLKRS